ncbi:cytochrome b/b6 domain-containing protein [Chitinibacter sp. FCG-7]|uniref:Cytochrome b/b6 domain-containing protein n=1 Tax=Chitinibacter mangrovi TaxID=3153927 RepID=A0AAU7F8N5_9NEIS
MTPNIRPEAEQYHPFSVLMHWLTVLLVLGIVLALGLAQWFGRGSSAHAFWLQAHSVLGQMTFGVSLLRLLVLNHYGAPAPCGEDEAQVLVAKVMHALLYGLIGFLACSGVLLSVAYLAGQSVLGMTVPMTLNPQAMGFVRQLHVLVAMGFVFIALAHGLYASAMHYFAGRVALRRLAVRDLTVVDAIAAPQIDAHYIQLEQERA